MKTIQMEPLEYGIMVGSSIFIGILLTPFWKYEFDVVLPYPSIYYCALGTFAALCASQWIYRKSAHNPKYQRKSVWITTLSGGILGLLGAAIASFFLHLNLPDKNNE
jgi:hypothetical protein